MPACEKALRHLRKGIVKSDSVVLPSPSLSLDYSPSIPRRDSHEKSGTTSVGFNMKQ
jgi:hypothetical protein